jgi:hypothetical protein
MNDTRPDPLAFANRVIRQFVDNHVDPDCTLLKGDYTVLRRVFRRLGGSWERLVQGDPRHVGLLSELTRAWGQRMKARRVTKPGEGEPIDA